MNRLLLLPLVCALAAVAAGARGSASTAPNPASSQRHVVPREYPDPPPLSRSRQAAPVSQSPPNGSQWPPSTTFTAPAAQPKTLKTAQTKRFAQPLSDAPIPAPHATAPPGGGINYIHWRLPSRQAVAEHWPQQQPVPVGSLLKPFVALAAGEARRYAPSPTVECHGTATRCWLPQGHGLVHLQEAITYSCNTYFLVLARHIPPTTVVATCHRFGLRPPRDDSAETLTGFGRGWPQSPTAILRAFAQLIESRDAPSAGDVLRGMHEASTRGTASPIGRRLSAGGALAKTGTAPCSHTPRAAADGYVLVATPADAPRDLVLFMGHARTGRETAEATAQMLPGLLRQ